MDSFVELTGRSLDEIRARAAAKLGIPEDQIDIEILEEKRTGFLGLLGSVEIVARATARETAEAACTPQGEDTTTGSVEALEDSAAESERGGEEGPDDELARLANRAEQVANEILNRMQVDVQARAVEIGPDEVYIELSGNDIALVIGKHGDTLDALQLLVAIIANRGAKTTARVVLDAEDYRDRRRRSLEATAHAYALKAKQTGQEVVIRDLKPYERRIIHLALRDDPGVETYSEGEGRHRNLVVTPVGLPNSTNLPVDAHNEEDIDISEP
ncbi:MAG: RNA-binding cell elongation regulator Jag/EloR [Candidatus Zipacnadales bacterium]